MNEKPLYELEELLALIPHRPPFLFVDRVVKLTVDKQPADRGRLHLLMLQPLTQADAQELQKEASQGPIAAKGSDSGPGQALRVTYSYQGEPALARELPAGTDPASVTIP